MKKIISSFFIALLCVATAFAQTDSRNRVASTIIADGLAQLPAANTGAFNQVISEMAGTGEQGVLQIAGNLKPAGSGAKNSVFEYALSGITDYAASAAGEKCRAGVRSGLAKAVEGCSDVTNKTFLMTLLARVATPADVALFAKYLGDEKLSIPALAAITKISGADAEALNVVKTATNVPKYSLAKIVEYRKLQGVEDLLLSWAKESDPKTKIAVYDAMAAVGGDKSLKVLESAAKTAAYAPEASHALDAYIKALDRSTDNSAVAKAAKALAKAASPATRCAGLRLALKTAGAKAAKEVVAALKDNDIEYRNTALDFAQQYAGKEILSTVASNYKKLSAPAKIDVVRWLGNNHFEAQAIYDAIGSADSALSCAGMQAASKVGGQKALQALLGQLSKKNGAYASEQLLSFKGDIASGVVSTLKNSHDAPTLVAALNLAGERHIHSAYGDVVKLAANSDASVSSAAYSALAGVAASDAGLTDGVASLLEKSSGASVEKLQQALCNSQVAQSAQNQYSKAAQLIKGSSHPEYYYPLLAQSGTAEALADLQKALGNSSTADAAAKALLIVDNSDVIPVLLGVAKTNAKFKDSMIDRYVSLVDKYAVNGVWKYQRLVDALDTNPADNLVGRIVTDLASTNCVQALAVLADKMGDSKYAFNAAYSFKNIIGSNGSLNAGKAVLDGLNKAKEVCQAKKETGDADAGYAVDQIAGLVSANDGSHGFTLGTATKTIAAGGKETLAKNQENLALTFDWKTDGEATLVLRSLPIVRLSAQGVRLAGGDKSAVANAAGEFNTLEVRLVDDRLFVTSNGVKLVENMLLKDAAGQQKSPTSGDFEVTSDKGTLTLRNANTDKLPATPTYTLSADEKKAGFEVLFDGHSLDKWQGNTVNYTPDNGTIYVTANYGGSGNLYTKKKYSDFVYRFEFCFVTPGVNNGVGIRTNIGTDAAYDGMEIQILDHDDPIYADLRPYQQHGSVYGICVPKHVKFGKLGTWNTEEIRAVGDRITVTVNGEVITDCNIREATKGHNVAPDGGKTNPYTVDHNNHPGLFNKDGYISFCGHGPGVRFRNIRILDLSKSAKKTATSKARRSR